MSVRPSPSITIFSGICVGFLLGTIFSKIMTTGDDWLTFEIYVIEIRYGLIFAAISGLIASIFELLIWFDTKGNPKYIIQAVTED